MKINTMLFGEVEIDPANIIIFPKGLPAFEQCRRYTMFHDIETEKPILFRLQCVDDPQVMFTLTDPLNLGFNYDISLTDEESALLELERPEDAAVMLMLGQRADDPTPSGITFNISAPLVLNLAKLRGLQKVLPKEYNISYTAPQK